MAEPGDTVATRSQPVSPVAPDDRGRPGSYLPIPLTSFVGREREVAAVSALLRRRDVRLVTLTGPGGVGKTRLAIAVAAELEPEFADGMAFVDLTPLTDPDLVAPAVARSLGVQESGDRPVAERLVDVLRERNLLLVLDNFERVVEAAPLLARLLATCAGLKMLVTSREMVRLSAERIVAVPPLALPAPDHKAQELAEVEAVRLFADRAQAARIDFELTDQNASAVAEVVARLDGLPLAIELAASRVGHLPPAALLARLEKRLPLLIGGARDLPARQQTLREAIAWSHDLLSTREQALFRRLAVFVGAFTLDAAEAVAVDAGMTVLDGVASLMAKSLLRQQEGAEDEARYRMLETVREFALERLEASEEEEEARGRHATYFVGLAERAEGGFYGPDEIAWLDRCESDRGNLRAALAWATGDGSDPVLALRLTAALLWFWLIRAPDEGAAWLEQALACGSNAPPTVRAKSMAALGVLTIHWTDYTRTEELLEEALALYRAASDPVGSADAQLCLGLFHFSRGQVDRVTTLLNGALDGFRAVGDRAGQAFALLALGRAARAAGDFDHARALMEEALGLNREIGFLTGVADTLGSLGATAFVRGDYGQAETLGREALTLHAARGDLPGATESLVDMALIAAERGQEERAARLYAAADTLRRSIGTGVPGYNRARDDRFVRRLLLRLGDEGFATAWAAGRALSLEDAVAEAIVPNPATASAPPDPAQAVGLTPREQEVLRLLVEGRSNPAIAEALFVSPTTVRGHVTNILAKLGVTTRTEAAARAVRDGLL